MSGKTAREERREERLRSESAGAAQERRRRLLLQLGSAAVFLAVIAVAVLIVVSQSDSGSGDVEDAASIRKELKGIPQAGLILGDPSAKVTLFEFGDLQCPACKAYSEEVIPNVIDSRVRSGQAKIEFRNFTIINQESVPAGAAAIAAGKQGHGWDYLEIFYRNQGPEASGYVTDSFMTEIAKAAGVADIAKWNADRKSKPVLREVSRTTNEANRLGFTGTPSFAVKGPGTEGLRTLGTPDPSSLEQAIEEAE